VTLATADDLAAIAFAKRVREMLESLSHQDRAPVAGKKCAFRPLCLWDRLTHCL
jgi:hypothetical protein